MYLRLAMKEKGKHKKLFLFIICQLAITFIAAICCVSIVERQYERYDSLKVLFDKEGWFVNTNLGVRVPESDVGTGKTGMEILQKYLKHTDIVCTYSILGEFIQDSNPLEIEGVAYDKEFIENMTPSVAEGRWLESGKNNSGEIEGVISQNYYGLGVGDIIHLAPYFAENTNKVIPVKIVGVLNEDADIIKMNYSSNMVNFNNFIFNLEQRENALLILPQEDIMRLSNDWAQLSEVLWPQGLLFIQYNEGITDEEKRINEEFIDNHIEIAIREPLTTIQKKSILYVKEQIGEILPVFSIFLIMTMMSTVCVSTLVAKQNIKNMYIFRIIGIDKGGCILIQFLVHLLVLFESFIVTALGCLLLNSFGENIIFLDFGLYQVLVCTAIAVFFLGVAYIVQKNMLKDYEIWRIRQ